MKKIIQTEAGKPLSTEMDDFLDKFMECHSIQFTTISINVERGIVKILFKYRYFQDLLIDIDIFGIALSISISILIFFRIALSICQGCR